MLSQSFFPNFGKGPFPKIPVISPAIQGVFALPNGSGNTSEDLYSISSTHLVYFPVGTADDQQMAQLQILYKARGSKIEDLVNEMDLLKQGMGREIRILKHHLSMAKGKATSKNSHVSVSPTDHQFWVRL